MQIVQSVHEGRIYTVKLFCDKDYPDRPPSVKFHSRINMTCVNQETGMVSMALQEGLFTFIAARN
jgi:ubiquitin-conjugating enzyme E2 variant